MSRSPRRVLGSRKAAAEAKVERWRATGTSPTTNFLLVTLDSCRYDAFVDAETPILDDRCDWYAAESPATYTYAAHQSFFVGLLPNVPRPIPYYNRFTRQLIGLIEVGERPQKKATYVTVASNRDVIDGCRTRGMQTVGTGAMNWFRQESLTGSFDRFKMHEAAEDQIAFLREEIDPERPFFAFANFGETHDPFDYRGKKEKCPVRVQARLMEWPPAAAGGPVGRDHPAYWHQVEAVSYLDTQLAGLFAGLPGNTIAIVCGDHGECFGEDGYWGHGVSHPKVLEVPLGIFRLDGEPIERASG